MASALSASSAYRIVDAFHPTLLCDEGDTYLKNDEQLRGIFNSGHDREGAYKLVCVEGSKGWEVRCFSTWAAKVLALIGDAPLTVDDRSVIIKLHRKKRSDSITRLRGHEEEITNLGRQCARWAADHIDQVRGRDAKVPDKISSDRSHDNWRFMLLIADVVGPAWGVRARAAACVMEGAGIDSEPDTMGARLLLDIKTVFEDRNNPKALTITDLINGITDIDEAP